MAEPKLKTPTSRSKASHRITGLRSRSPKDKMYQYVKRREYVS